MREKERIVSMYILQREVEEFIRNNPLYGSSLTIMYYLGKLPWYRAILRSNRNHKPNLDIRTSFQQIVFLPRTRVPKAKTSMSSVPVDFLSIQYSSSNFGTSIRVVANSYQLCDRCSKNAM